MTDCLTHLNIRKEIKRENMLTAYRKDYRKGFQKHYSAYKRIAHNNDCYPTRMLLLCYCVECGLKYKICRM